MIPLETGLGAARGARRGDDLEFHPARANKPLAHEAAMRPVIGMHPPSGNRGVICSVRKSGLVVSDPQPTCPNDPGGGGHHCQDDIVIRSLVRSYQEV